MPLLELTVVILVILSLISILFIGARAWKKGSDRAASILQIRNMQQAVRSYSNMAGHNPGYTHPHLKDSIIGPGMFIEQDPTDDPDKHPAGGTYYFSLTAGGIVIPAIGDLYMITLGEAENEVYVPATGTHGDW